MTIAPIGASISSWMPTTKSQSNLADEIFSKLDTRQQGYLSEADVESAFGSTSSQSSSDSQAVFKAMDSDGDGRVTKAELSTVLDQVAQALDKQMMMGKLDERGPPPPPGDTPDDAGLSKDQMSQMASSSSTGSAQVTDLKNLLNAFEEADTNEDGKVSLKEAMAFKAAQQKQATSDQTGGDAEADSGVSRVLQMIAQYLGAQSDGSRGGSTGGALSVCA